jgi:DNA-binding beta-propeller fold protein YncE
MLPGDIPFQAERAGAREAAPELPDALTWVNRRGRLRLADLRGRVVLVFFWNATSASSTNLLAELRQLEKKYPGAFVLVGVHTPRYASQRPDPVVLQAVQRCRVRAPVANDCDWLAWRSHSIPAWPTTLLLDADGGLAARFVGDGRSDEIEEVVLRLQEGLPPAHTRPALDMLDGARAPAPGALAFPAHALATNRRLFVSDSGHHRVLECSHDGRVLRQFGSGTPGNWDGQMAACGFQSPQGLALSGDTLYVADTGNHCVRRIRLETGEVDTVLGNGRPAYDDVETQGSGLRVAVNAPRALVVEGDVLLVAATGQNQIVRVDLRDASAATLVGDGRRSVRDGIGSQASLAQPSALASMPGQLLVADAGGNAIRRVRFADLAVTTLAGSTAWEPGCADGTGDRARFAWPSGLAVAGERVYVADTCNDRLCVLDPYSGDVESLQFDYPLHEPQGLSFAADALWVADRNDHAILRVDPAHGTCERVAVDE